MRLEKWKVALKIEGVQLSGVKENENENGSPKLKLVRKLLLLASRPKIYALKCL